MQRPLKYPVGIQTFSEIIDENYIYVDKTELLYQLVNSYKYVFLSRPRRFGKTLFASTLEEYFSGNRQLFKGLKLDRLETDWVKHPVLRMDLSGVNYEKPGALSAIITHQFAIWEKLYPTDTPADSDIPWGLRFEMIIRQAYRTTGKKVVVIIDEYDKPILDVIHLEDSRNLHMADLREFYSVLKKSDACLKFVFITGITKFGQLSVFSGLNNLADISFHRRYNAICGITQQEMQEVFGPSVAEFAEVNNMEESQVWDAFKANFDGYHFCANGADIYNPFSVLSAFAAQSIDDYWFESGTPRFLVKLMRRDEFHLGSLEGLRRTKRGLTDLIDLSGDYVALLYQSGYLTLKGYDPTTEEYLLGFPNKEVSKGFWDTLAKEYFDNRFERENFSVLAMARFLRKGKIEDFLATLKSLLASVSSKSEPNKELHFQNMLVIIVRMLTMEVDAEIESAMGRCDVRILTNDYIYIIECKIDSTPEVALNQIKQRGYATPYLSDHREKILVGLDFSTISRTISAYRIERLK
ncbi:MAG: ATP-binding protein [Muribaculaceae bacterium]|nr:ATP-binding protein [Muribaculaceae bacterium]MDE5957866.1 ATP-binding protein [Muribaculaceae bacterium]